MPFPVGQGNVYTKIVKKDGLSLEDQVMTLDVVETYVPIIEKGAVIGAFEIYYDITDFKKRLQHLLRTSLLVLIALVAGLLFSIIMVLVRAAKHDARRKKTEDWLRQSEKRYRTMIESIEDAYYEIDLAGNFTFANEKICNIFGYTWQELKKIPLRDYYHADITKSVYQAFNNIFKTGEPLKGLRYEIIRKNGTALQVINSLDHAFHDKDEGKILVDIYKEAGQLVISYNDNGKGMDEKTVKKIFDPFFTTNRAHGGTGLGMHIVFNLVTQKLNGQIECNSTPGMGTVFLIKIPLENGTHSSHSAALIS
jgi:PAS domain S-box-containing protein